MAQESDKEFVPWFKEFVDKVEGGYTRKSWVPQDLEAWVAEIDAGHQEIRNLLGGTRKTFKVEESEGQGAADYNSVYKLYNTINLQLPDYFLKYNLNQNHLAFPNIPEHKNISTAKHILGYADRQKLPPEKKKILEDAVAQMGLAWAQAKQKGPECFATITTTPQAFCLLGNYGIDGNSCFRHGSFNSDKRYAAGIMKESFVVLFHKKEEVEEKNQNSDIIGRCIGMLTKHKDEPIFNTVNHYPYSYGYGKAETNAVGCGGQVKLLASKFLGLAEPESLSNFCQITGGINYGQYIGFSVFDKKKIGTIPRQVVDVDAKYSTEKNKPTGYDSYARW